MFEFAYSSWSAEMGGGIYWREDDPATKNICSNGPAALLALKLYEETQEARYVEIATQILERLRRLRTEGGYYWDAMNSDGSVDKRTFTYNTATPLHSYALLCQITANPEYLMEAQALAQRAHRHFAPVHATAGVSLYPKMPWFNAVLLKAYLALSQIDGDTHYIEAMRDGLLSGDWSGESGVDISSQFILDQGAGVELLALIAGFNP
jgi:uncharacterized protein YyaL (SSP411 family)